MRTLGVAAMGSSAAFALAFGAFPGSWVTNTFLWPGIQLIPALGRAVPDAFVYALIPEGGAPAGLALILTGSLLTWGIVSVLAWNGARHALGAPAITRGARSKPTGRLSREKDSRR
jgi:hypothetical protein